MKYRLKPLNEQVIVITGASSGIGLATARDAARQGAQVVLAARNGQALRQIVDDIRREGGRAIHVEADVADEADVRRIAQAAVDAFGGFDTWVNNASATIYGSLMENTLEDQRRLFDVNFWGMVHGCRVAVPHLKKRGGGAIINVGSIESDRAFPLMGIYAAAKHAVKGYTDALRMELEREEAGISVTLMKPGSTDTMLLQHARNYMDEAPALPPPVYSPHVVAKAILHCATHPRGRMMIGTATRAIAALGTLMPRVMDYVQEKFFYDLQRSGKPAEQRQGNLHHPQEDGRESGDHEGMVRQTSLYTAASRHPLLTAGLVLGGVAAAAALLATRTGTSPGSVASPGRMPRESELVW